MAKLCTFELENGADVHAETRFWGGPKPIHEWCAQRLQEFETEYERGTGYCRLDNLEKMREINKLVMDKKQKTTVSFKVRF